MSVAGPGPDMETKFSSLASEVVRLQNTVCQMEKSKMHYENSTRKLVNILESLSSQLTGPCVTRHCPDTDSFDSVLSRRSSGQSSLLRETTSISSQVTREEAGTSPPVLGSGQIYYVTEKQVESGDSAVNKMITEVDSLMLELQSGVRKLSGLREALKAVSRSSRSSEGTEGGGRQSSQVKLSSEEDLAARGEAKENSPSRREISFMVNGKEVNVVAVRPKVDQEEGSEVKNDKF